MASWKLETLKKKITQMQITSQEKALNVETLLCLEEDDGDNNDMSEATPLTSFMNLTSTKSCLPKFSTIKTNTPSDTALKISKTKWKPGQLKESAEQLRRHNREQNKLKIFEGELKRLKAAQSRFMATCEEAKNINACLITRKYKFIGVQINDQFQLLVNEDDLLRFPKNLPIATIHDLKRNVKNCLKGALTEMVDHLKSLQNIQDASHLCNHIAVIDQMLNNFMSAKLDVCMKQIDHLCKHPTNDDLEKASSELQESRRSCQTLEDKLNIVRKWNMDQIEILSNRRLKVANKAKEVSEKLLKEQIKDLDNRLAHQELIMGEQEKIIESQNQDIKTLQKVILELKSKKTSALC